MLALPVSPWPSGPPYGPGGFLVASRADLEKSAYMVALRALPYLPSGSSAFTRNRTNVYIAPGEVLGFCGNQAINYVDEVTFILPDP